MKLLKFIINSYSVKQPVSLILGVLGLAFITTVLAGAFIQWEFSSVILRVVFVGLLFASLPVVVHYYNEVMKDSHV